MLAALLLLFCLGTRGAMHAAGFRTELFATGISRPVFVTAPPGDTERVFILEQHTGRVRIHNADTGATITPAFLDLSGLLTGGEQGLLGMAFHPGYATNGYFYLNFTLPGGGNGGHTEVARYQAVGDPGTSSQADPDSKTLVLSFNQPQGNHNAGWLGFGLDGYLYIATGDGGGSNDQHGSIGNSQNRANLLGKILRIDVNGSEIAHPQYAIPEDNPYKGQATFAEEIWAFGLRNPWRCSIDRETGDLWIGDVGQGAREEIDFNPAGQGGLNFGWRPREGSIQTPAYPNESPVTTATDPVFDYPRSGGYSVTGGYVYRGSRIPELQGKYILTDYGSARFWVISREGDEFMTVERTADFRPSGSPTLNIPGPSSFGEDARGELYICDLDGDVFRIVPTLPPAPEITIESSPEPAEFVFSFSAAEGVPYTLESRTSLTTGDWTEVTTIPAPASDGPISVTNQIDQAAEYFRVRAN